MNLDSVIDRLVNECPLLKLVGGAGQFAKAAQGLTTTPASFVLPARETGGENPFASQLVEQNVSVEFAIVTAIKNVADATGAAALDALAPVRIPQRAAILGWAPAGDAESDDYQTCEFVSGELTSLENGVLWWTDTYRTAFILRSVQ